MHERLKESLSALKDGEADELELRRLLNELDDNPELSQTWARYEMMGALMRDEAISTVDLSRGIRQAIDGEPMDEVPAAQPAATATTTTSSGQWQQWLTGGAVAASVTLAVLLGVRLESESAQPIPVAHSPAAVPSQSQLTAQPVMLPAQPERQLVAQESQPVGSDIALPEAQRKLQQYVLQHTENAALNTGRGMMPFARVASFAERTAEASQPVHTRPVQAEKQRDAQQ
ncbi:sigma factor AlgU negative regulatory protein [Bacterioplanes sanyensis]|uniref:sigma-E factor negative regulatory protein n=1 Tax=Bacterioplanes sanyensis TaxID=1249553 RepID=UPI0016750955|nr:sigma-E factor negative regulatory protein [Bacterioplanes sanyensis]GGY45240.1 sigma factor AlgU negative regulatory protein [Bacterioplanes sanyensis]